MLAHHRILRIQLAFIMLATVLPFFSSVAYATICVIQWFSLFWSFNLAILLIPELVSQTLQMKNQYRLYTIDVIVLCWEFYCFIRHWINWINIQNNIILELAKILFRISGRQVSSNSFGTQNRDVLIFEIFRNFGMSPTFNKYVHFSHFYGHQHISNESWNRLHILYAFLVNIFLLISISYV